MKRFLSIAVGILIGLPIAVYADTQRPEPKELLDRPDPIVQEIDLNELRPDPVIEDVRPRPDDADVDLLARVIYWEAGNQDSYGKRLVADVVLNRAADRSGIFPDTIHEVVFQPGQFSVARIIYEGEIPEECYQIAIEEMIDQVDYQVLWFNCGDYLPYGTPAFQYGDHCFSR